MPKALNRIGGVMAGLVLAGSAWAQGVPPAEVIALVDIAHTTQMSVKMMSMTPTDAANWLVNAHFVKGAQKGVTKVVIKHPYRWRPAPYEDYRFGGQIPAQRAAIHAAIALARAQHLPLPTLCVYQDLPRGTSLSAADQVVLNEQRVAFDEDAWEAVGCAPWQQAILDQRRLTRAQHIEPVWDIGFPQQWTYPIDVTEEFLANRISQYMIFPTPRPEIRCWMFRPIVARAGETGAQAYLRTVRGFYFFCHTRGYTPATPLDLFTELNFTAQELFSVCDADYDANTFVNADDFDGFTSDFYYGMPNADLDGNGFVNGDDFDGFVAAYLKGC